MDPEELGRRVQLTLQEAPFAMRQLAQESGLSYDVLRSWRSGRRRPSRRSAARLADALEQRGDHLHELAARLRGQEAGLQAGQQAGQQAGED